MLESSTFQIGANKDQKIDVTFAKMDSTSLGVKDIDLSVDAATSTAAIDTIDAAIKNVSDERSQLGAKQNRLEHTINNLSTSSENLTAAESRIRDVDMAKRNDGTNKEFGNSIKLLKLCYLKLTSSHKMYFNYYTLTQKRALGKLFFIRLY